MNDQIYDVIIIGSGPAGLTAGIYSARGNRKTLIIAGRVWGGQLMLTTLVENYPGFEHGIQGPDLMTAMRHQTENQGAEFVDVDFKNANFNSKPFEITTDDNKVYKGRAVIIATGANTKWLDVPGEKEKIGRGVSSCAPCDAAFFKNKKVIVVGGGDSALEEATVLSKFASEIYLVHRRDNLKASAAMQKRAFSDPKIKFIWNTEIRQIQGENKVEKVALSSKLEERSLKLRGKFEGQDKQFGVEELGGKVLKQETQSMDWEFPVDGVFVAIGHIPNSEAFKGVDTDEKGFIKVYDHTRTNLDGVFVAGDVHDAEYKQAVTAAGFGCMAALEVEKWFENIP